MSLPETRSIDCYGHCHNAELVGLPEHPCYQTCYLSEFALELNPVRARWRVGRKVGRTIYASNTLIGVMDTPELAMEAVEAHNRLLDKESNL